jgi:hypothetical protein
VNYVFPDVARPYAVHLRARAGAGEHDGANGPQQLAAQLKGELNAIHRDAHLRVTLSDGPEPSHTSPAPSGDGAFGDAQWLASGVAYLRINELPGDEASVRRMNALLDQYASASTIVLDLRTCRGGALAVMDARSPTSTVVDRGGERLTFEMSLGG